MGYTTIGWPAVDMVRADRDKRLRQGTVYCNGVQLDAFLLGRIHVLDSLDIEGNTGTKQDPLVISGKDARMMKLVMGWMSKVNPV